MPDDTATNQSKERTHYVPACWCPPASTFGAYLWGILLILGGSVWLLNNLEVLPPAFVEAFWPLVLVGVGLAYLARAAAGRLARFDIRGG